MSYQLVIPARAGWKAVAGLCGLVTLGLGGAAAYSLWHHQAWVDLTMFSLCMGLIAAISYSSSQGMTLKLEGEQGFYRWGAGPEVRFATREVSQIKVRGNINWASLLLVLPVEKLTVLAGIPRTEDGQRRLREVIRELRGVLACPVEIDPTVGEWFHLTES